MQNKTKYLILTGIIIGLVMFLKWQFRVKGESFFSQMIDQAENDMVALDQDDYTRDLLERFKPTIYVDQTSFKPLDFYEDILPNASLMKSGMFDKKISDSISRDMLWDYHRKPLYYFDYQVSHSDELARIAKKVPIYGRVYKSYLEDKELVFLKYTLTFPYSGLPENVEWYKKIGSHILGNPKAWHELDIHGAIHVVLHEEKVIALLLAQHNHHKTYLVDGPVSVVFSKYSNEPYLVTDGKNRLERTVGNPLDMSFLIGLSDKVPLTGGYDEIPSLEETIEVETFIEQLSLDDPLYKSSMSLGDRKKILGIFNTFYMEGPPGIDYYTMPDLLDLSNLLAFWYINPNTTYKEIYASLDLSFSNYDVKPLLDYQKERLYDTLFK